MKKFIIQFILLIVIIAGAVFFYRSESIPLLPQQPRLIQASIGEALVNVEIADTQEKRNLGLGGRDFLATDSGMLFIFPKEDFYSFWMKGLKFPLDFIWIKGDKVVDITENVPVPPEGAKDEQLPIYQSKERVDRLLEVNSGFILEHGIKIGDTVIVKQ